jgi:transposase
MCTIYAAAARRMLPGARLAVDLFHVVQLAVKATGDVRRRVVRGKYRRRGRSGDRNTAARGPPGIRVPATPANQRRRVKMAPAAPGGDHSTQPPGEDAR